MTLSAPRSDDLWLWIPDLRLARPSGMTRGLEEVVISRLEHIPESGCAPDSFVVACPFRKTGFHFSGTCSRRSEISGDHRFFQDAGGNLEAAVGLRLQGV